MPNRIRSSAARTSPDFRGGAIQGGDGERLIAGFPFLRQLALIRLTLIPLVATISDVVRNAPAAEAADDDAKVPGKPTGSRVHTTTGSLEVSVDWNYVGGTAGYSVKWRLRDFRQELNVGVERSERRSTSPKDAPLSFWQELTPKGSDLRGAPSSQA